LEHGGGSAIIDESADPCTARRDPAQAERGESYAVVLHRIRKGGLMLNLFGGGKPDHPMAEIKEARRILDDTGAIDPFKASEELANWFDSVRSTVGFKPEHRAQLVQLIDEAAQAPVRKLSSEYRSSPRLSRFQENRLWHAIHDYWKAAALAFATCIDLYATGAKGANVLKNVMPLLTVRALRALAAQMKWQYLRYGPFDNSNWGLVAKIYALAEAKKYARTRATVDPNVAGESSPELEFLKIAMLSASSPDGLVPAEIEVAERLIAHFSSSFTLVLEQQPDIAYWIDLATSRPPLRLARLPQHAPSLRFFAAGKAGEQLDQLRKSIRASRGVPTELNLGASVDPDLVLAVLDHLAVYWSPKPPARKFQRHTVKSRLNVTSGFDGVLAALDPSSTLEFDQGRIENWIVENVSAGGFGALVPQIKGDWLRIGALVALQPEGGENWVIGVIRRFSRDTPQRGTVGIQTLAKSAQAVSLRAEGARGTAVTGLLLNPQGAGSAAEAEILLHSGAPVTGQNLEMEVLGKRFLLMPGGAAEHGEDYQLMRVRMMVRDSGE
jgi:hypothetical protein